MIVRRLRDVRGLTITELIVVMIVIGVAASVAIPRALKSTPQQDVVRAAKQLTRDLEQVRTQAVSAKRRARVRFDNGLNFYTAFLDVTEGRSGTIEEVTEEVYESRMVVRGAQGGVPGVELPEKVVYGTGAASESPLGGPMADDPIQLDNDRVDFNSRGMVLPLGTGGTVYLTHEDDPDAVAAVTISGAGGFQTWVYRNGKWER